MFSGVAVAVIVVALADVAGVVENGVVALLPHPVTKTAHATALNAQNVWIRERIRIEVINSRFTFVACNAFGLESWQGG